MQKLTLGVDFAVSCIIAFGNTQSIAYKHPPDQCAIAHIASAVLGKFQDMGWHPAIAKTEGSGDNTVGAKRTLTLKSGGTIGEELIKYDDGKSYAYEIKEVDVKVLPVTNYASSMRVTEDGGKSTVEWKGAFYRGYVNNDPPPELSDEAAVKAVAGIYKAGLEALKAKVEAGG